MFSMSKEGSWLKDARVESIHGFLQSSKLQATTWARSIDYGMGTDLWARGNGFLGAHSSMGWFSVQDHYGSLTIVGPPNLKFPIYPCTIDLKKI